jgi:hypothetical protein
VGGRLPAARGTRGYAGVNLHGGGESYDAPITGEPRTTKSAPQYHGMLRAQRFAGTTFVGASFGGDARNVNGYAARVEDALAVAGVNKSANPVQLGYAAAMAKAAE